MTLQTAPARPVGSRAADAVVKAIETRIAAGDLPDGAPLPPERNRVNFLRHSDIYRAIRDRDPDGAEAALNAHLNAAWEYVRGTFDDI